jgi:hypothetical protein
MKLKYTFLPVDDEGKPLDISDAIWLLRNTDDMDPMLLSSLYYGMEVETKFGRKKLYRIKGMDGRTGGLVESPMNLSQSGECWIHPDAIVCGEARVIGNAQVKGGQIGGYAVIGGDAVVEGQDTVVDGYAAIYGRVSDSKVWGRGMYDTGGGVNDSFLAGMRPTQTNGGGDGGGGNDEDAKKASEDPETIRSGGMTNRAIVYPTGVVENGSVVAGMTRIYGHIANAMALGNAVVYGTVKDKAIAGGKCMVMSGAVMSGKVLISDGHVEGSVTVG